jgi:YD repeat-containing protein
VAYWKSVWKEIPGNSGDSLLNCGYDSYGNLINRTTSYGAGATETLVYDDLHRLMRSTSQTGSAAAVVVDYDYDENGNLTGNGSQILTYNAFNKPLTITDGAARSSFSYGADVLRYRQIKPGGERIYYLDQLMEIEMAGTECELLFSTKNGL